MAVVATDSGEPAARLDAGIAIGTPATDVITVGTTGAAGTKKNQDQFNFMPCQNQRLLCDEIWRIKLRDGRVGLYLIVVISTLAATLMGGTIA